FGAATETFALDGASNITSRTGPGATYTYDTSNRLTGDGTQSLVWSPPDRLATRGVDSFSYDPLGRLTSSTVSGQLRGYAYDGDGLLASRTEGANTTAFIWDRGPIVSGLIAFGIDRIVS